MRVAVHFADDHPQHPGAVVAYRLGRIEEGVHNTPPGHDPVSLTDFVSRLSQQAQAEFPDALKVTVERLVDNGDATSRWVDASEFDPAVHTPVGSGQTVERALTVTPETASTTPKDD